MNTIVAPTDFSPISLNAVEYAADIASATGADLILVHVCVVPMNFDEMSRQPYDLQQMTKEAEEKINKLKKNISERMGSHSNVNAEVIPGLTVAEEIDNFCLPINPRLVVMGTQGSSALERVVYGRNTLASMKDLYYPLIVVPPGARFKHIRKIGLACDLERVKETAPIKEIKGLIKEFHAELHVLYVNREIESDPSSGITVESAKLREMLSDLWPVYHFLTNVDIEKGLAEFAEENNLDLLIVVPKNHDLLHNLIYKSHTNKLMVESHVPVMSLHECG